MKARIYQTCPNGLYWGQIYDEYHNRWTNVTYSCLTKWGAKRELFKWMNKNRPKEFEI